MLRTGETNAVTENPDIAKLAAELQLSTRITAAWIVPARAGGGAAWSESTRRGWDGR